MNPGDEMMEESIIDLNIKLIADYIEVKKMNLNMFFDESNNVRVGRLSEKGTNENIHNVYFVLGGISYYATSNVDLNDIFTYIGVHQIPNDAKLKYFTRGRTEFKDILKETRLLKYFQFLKEKNIFIHFNSFHFLYYSLIDILDSLFEESDENQQVYYEYNQILKSDLIEVLDLDYDRVLEILREFNYPSILKEHVSIFISKILDLYTELLEEHFNDSDPENFTKEMLRQMIKSKKDRGNLLFLDDNKKFIITESLFEIYLHNACLFSRENKIFDDESVIKNKFEILDLNFENKLNMKFNRSHDDIGVQLSDVLTGFTAKMLNFVSSKTLKEIEEFSREIDDTSLNTLKLFFEILDYSYNCCQHFFVWQIPYYVFYKLNYFIDKIVGM